MACGRCNDTKLICEAHPQLPADHGCGAPGEPCPVCWPSDRVGVPEQRGSIRNVTVAGDPVSYSCEVRTLPGSGLRPGDIVFVEFGAYWSNVRGEPVRHPGHWRRCMVLPNATTTQADVHVRLDPLPPLPSVMG